MPAVALALILALPWPQLLEEAHHGPSPWYRAVVERYRSGDRKGALAEPFPPEKALYEVSALRRLAEDAQRCSSCAARVQLDAFPLEAAVLLHTERAIDRMERYDSFGPAELEIAPRIVELMPEARRRAFEPRWVQAAALALGKSGKWSLALGLLDPALRRYADDPLLHLARGAALESSAWLNSDEKREASARRANAEKSYRQALALRPGLHEARVRLGRTLQLLGCEDEAVRELQAVVNGAPGTLDRYLAHLFLGRARETAGRVADAVAEYQAALQAEPDGQAAAVALSHALHRAGRGHESVEALRAGVDRAGRRRAIDPWWPYLAGQWDDPDVLLEALRAEVAP